MAQRAAFSNWMLEVTRLNTIGINQSDEELFE
jgi:hypothetical protein